MPEHDVGLDQREVEIITKVTEGIVSIVDTARTMIDLVRLKDYLAVMRAQVRRLQGFPSSATHAQAAHMRYGADTFEAIVNLFEIRSAEVKD